MMVREPVRARILRGDRRGQEFRAEVALAVDKGRTQ